MDLEQTRWKIWRKIGKYAKFSVRKTQQASREALRFVVESKSDVFVNLPTGFGKSVVFQALPRDESKGRVQRVCTPLHP